MNLLDKTDVNALDVNKGRCVLITGDDFGGVKLFKFPCPKGTKFQRYSGHSAHVTNVKFTPNSRHAISTGGGDQSILQWKVLGNIVTEPPEVPDEPEQPIESDREKEPTTPKQGHKTPVKSGSPRYFSTFKDLML